ncbi:Ank-repeat protein mbp1 [Pleurostoma richardsiae]|uniref:Ank-repeat protein mbp1 n=1 Tax=Pleurostoma richardsiae TaxID=41990 RepID=A0AA38REK1_9PEZI|nr:Ank-repeat protein mbp1 [Pleurostoma richardsiae]
MLPGPLVSVYQQYKQDTDAIAAWLASTAKRCGYAADLLSSGKPAQTGSRRLKGKARKQDKVSGNASSGRHVSKANRTKYIVAIKDFIPLAEFIAGSSQPTVGVPHVFSDTIDRVITVRSSFKSRMAEHGAQLSEESDLTHSYFVGILENVREILKPKMPATVKPFPVPGSSDDAAEELANRFGALEVYEPSQEFLDAPDMERPLNADDDTAVYEAERQTTFEDAMVAYTMIINDINRIRSHIEWIWTNYRVGLFDLAAAAVATNTGIDLARNLMEDVIPLFKDHGGTWTMTTRFFTMCCLRKGYDIDYIFLEGSADNFNYDLYDIADGVYMTTYRILMSFRNVLNPRTVPIIKEGMFGTYNPSSDRKHKAGRQKFEEDQVLLMEFFTELMTVIRAVRDYPVEDEFIRGMREMDQTHDIPFYLVFAAQIFLDVHHILRDVAFEGLVRLVEATSVMDNDLGLHFDFHKILKGDTWAASNDHVVREQRGRLRWIGGDPVYKAKIKIYQNQCMSIPPTMQPHRILKYSPVLAGLMLYRFRIEHYEIGIAVASAWGSILYATHLYNALQSERLLGGMHWPDIDVAQTILGESSFYVGGRPTGPDDYLKKFCLHMGVSASAFSDSKKRRKNSALASRAGPRGIKEGIPVSSMFKDRYVHETGQVDWTPEHVDDIVERSEYEIENEAEDGTTLTMEKIDDQKRLEEKRGKAELKRKKAVRKKVTEGGRVAPEQLVKALVLALQAESMEMAFPYLTLHRWCWRLLRNVKEACDPLLRELYTPAYMERESELPFAVGYIFLAASGADGGRKDDRLMRAAAAAMLSMIDSGAGAVAIKILKEKLSFDVTFAEEEDDDF